MGVGGGHGTINDRLKVMRPGSGPFHSHRECIALGAMQASGLPAHIPAHHSRSLSRLSSAVDRGCVKTHRADAPSNIDLSESSVFDYFSLRKGKTTPETE